LGRRGLARGQAGHREPRDVEPTLAPKCQMEPHSGADAVALFAWTRPSSRILKAGVHTP